MSATGRGAPAQSATADREIVISRVISAPRELVFEAFTEVRHLSRWWGQLVAVIGQQPVDRPLPQTFPQDLSRVLEPLLCDRCAQSHSQVC